MPNFAVSDEDFPVHFARLTLSEDRSLILLGLAGSVEAREACPLVLEIQV